MTRIAVDVWSFLLEVAKVAGSSAIIVFGLVKWFGDKWLNKHFTSQLEALKHENQKELETVKQTIQSTFSRIVKVHEREYEVLPKAWFLLNVSLGHAIDSVARLKFRPTFQNMPDSQFEEFLESCKLTPYQRETLGKSANRKEYYEEAISGIELDDAQEQQRQFSNYLIEHRIFMSEDLVAKFEEVSKAISSGLIEYRIGKGANNATMEMAGIQKVMDSGNALPTILTLIQERLGYQKA